VIWIGRDNKQKNLPLLLDVVRVARSTGANLDFLIVGVDPSQKLSLQLIIEGATVVGRTEDVSEFLGSSSVLLSTSRFEGFPNVIIEALHLGLPICSTPSTSLLEEWCESEVVLIQRDSSPQGLVKDLEKHLQYYDEYSARALKCHNLSLKYSKDVSLEVWERLLERQSMT
jgi:GalNAc-alpha-(1->4)-GalNAc-alpha-(1->3)-diNAcBac-PP-undecaprenol alpha-1,4-N-acetyl-D-galactosaminyltransferase